MVNIKNMTEDDFMKRIEPSILNIIQVFNAIIDDAENNGFYPQEELYLLEDEQKRLFKEYDTAPQEQKMAIWEQLGNMSSILKKYKGKTCETAEALWSILANLEMFYNTFILKEEIK